MLLQNDLIFIHFILLFLWRWLCWFILSLDILGFHTHLHCFPIFVFVASSIEHCYKHINGYNMNHNVKHNLEIFSLIFLYIFPFCSWRSVCISKEVHSSLSLFTQVLYGVILEAWFPTSEMLLSACIFMFQFVLMFVFTMTYFLLKGCTFWVKFKVKLHKFRHLLKFNLKLKNGDS